MLPPVVVGLFVFMLLSRQGPLGSLSFLYTPNAMILAEFFITAPVIAAITMGGVGSVPKEVRLQAMGLGASRRQTIWLVMREARVTILSAIVAGFGAAISEVGAVMMVGGNLSVDGHNMTGTMTTAIMAGRLRDRHGLRDLAPPPGFRHHLHPHADSARHPPPLASVVSDPTRIAIEAEGLVKAYGERTVVSVDSFAIREGEVLALLGPNGAGKTTLFRLLALLERPDSGSIRYFGAPVDSRDLAARRRTASVFQRPLLFQGSVVDNVAFGLKFRHLPRGTIKRKVTETLDLMGVAPLAEADMRTLSGGELQRVALARALVLEPEILFLDEPTSNLDVHVRRRFREDLRRVVAQLSATVVIITHEHNEALALAQRVAVIHEGRLVQIGTPQEVFTHPQNAFVADFTGAETIWHGTVVSCTDGMCTVRTESGILVDSISESREGDRVAIAIRPEDVSLRLNPTVAEPGSSVRNRWCGVVDAMTPSGPLVRVVVRIECETGAAAAFGGEGEVISLITRASADDLDLKPGTSVQAGVKATALHVVEEM
jgi:tungstate transport system ATP-binding protein